MGTRQTGKVHCATTLATLLAGVCLAQNRLVLEEEADLLPPAHVAVDDPGGGVRRCLIICGLPGDAAHRKLFADSLELLHAGLVKHQGFAAQNIHLLWSDKPTEKDGAAVRAAKGEASRESIAEAAKTLRAALQPADVLWVFVLGHAHYDGKHSWLNVKGDDLHQLDFGRLFEGLRCREQAFFITSSASGFYLKPLAAPGRIVIAATEPDLEVNETLFPHKLAQVIGSPPPEGELDIDRDGQRTLLDLYLWTVRERRRNTSRGNWWPRSTPSSTTRATAAAPKCKSTTCRKNWAAAAAPAATSRPSPRATAPWPAASSWGICWPRRRPPLQRRKWTNPKLEIEAQRGCSDHPRARAVRASRWHEVC